MQTRRRRPRRTTVEGDNGDNGRAVIQPAANVDGGQTVAPAVNADGGGSVP